MRFIVFKILILAVVAMLVGGMSMTKVPSISNDQVICEASDSGSDSADGDEEITEFC